MKRLFKFLVASATSFSLLFANIPLAQMVVRADGDEVQPKDYIFDVDFNNSGDFPSYSLEGVVDVEDFIKSGSTFTLNLINKPEDTKVTFMYHWD